MVRRRMANPKPSAPVHRAQPFTNRTSSNPLPAHAPPARTPVPPTSLPPRPAPAAPLSQGPGLMGQMAATAGGVAIGSAVVRLSS